MCTDKILELLAKTLQIDKTNLGNMPGNTKLTDLGLDSIQFIQFIVMLEEELNIEILDSDLLMSKFETIDMLSQTLEKYFLSESIFKKILICDCDNVLWRGIAGEEKVYTDASTTEFQKMLIDLYNNGILICLCSKNEQENIEAAFDSLEMPLKKSHILLSRINSKDKATNIKEIALELNLSADSFVFVDDSPYEIDLVSSIIPEIMTIRVDYSDDKFINGIKSHFNPSNIVTNRTQQYREQKKREKIKQRCSNVEEFNNLLNTQVTCEHARPSQAARIAELSQRTNQFNLANTHYLEHEIHSFINDTNYTVYVLSASDIYGDMGIVGTAIVQKIEQPIIQSFSISCRVFGRGFELYLLNNIKCDFTIPLIGVYNKSDKNKRFENFYFENGIETYEQLL